jgi:hypothetical protein
MPWVVGRWSVETVWYSEYEHRAQEVCQRQLSPDWLLNVLEDMRIFFSISCVYMALRLICQGGAVKKK